MFHTIMYVVKFYVSLVIDRFLEFKFNVQVIDFFCLLNNYFVKKNCVPIFSSMYTYF